MGICSHWGPIKWNARKDCGDTKRKQLKEKKKERGTENHVRDQMRQRLNRGINKVVILYSSNEGRQSQ